MPTLLYIDDDDGLARLVDRGLTRLGFKVVHAAAATDGLDRLQQGGIDVDRARSVHARPRRPRNAGADHGDPERAAGGVRHRLAGFHASR